MFLQFRPKGCFSPRALALIAVCLTITIRNGAGASYQLITVETTWRYNQTADDLGTAWVAPTYDDTTPGWKGPSNILFGFETTPAEYLPLTFRTGQGGDFPNPTNVVPYVTNYYFRTHFMMPNLAAHPFAVTSLITTNLIDDSSVVYLNGVELFRFNMPAGPITATTFASAPLGVEGFVPQTQTVFFRTNSTANAVVGDNVLAVELHSADTNSSDEVFGLTLTAFVPDPIVITSQPVGKTNFVGSAPVRLSIEVTGSDPTYQWYSSNQAIPGATSRTQTVSTSRSDAGVDYYVIVSNALGSVTSSVATVQIVSDTFPIRLLSAFAGPPNPPGTPFLNKVDANFNKTVQHAATNLADYAITIFGTTNRLIITNAAVGGTQVRLAATTDFIFGTNYVLTVYNVTGTNFVPIAPNPSIVGISMVRTNPLPQTTNTSPVPPQLTIRPQTPSSEIISWTNTGGLMWGLESSTDLGNDVWTPLAPPSPYTNSSPAKSQFFRTRVK